VTVLEAAGRTGGHVWTVRDGLADGLYADAGAEHFTVPGYELYRQYVKEFQLPVVEYPRRQNILRRINEKFYNEEMLGDAKVLKTFGFNQREVDFLVRHEWWELPLLYCGPYLDNFQDEYQPFSSGLDELDEVSVTKWLEKEGASAAAIRFIGGEGVSALYQLWHAAILHRRGVPIFPTKIFRLQGGNQRLPDTFAEKLEGRVRLGCPITGIAHGESGVSVTYREFGETKQMEAEYLVNTIPITLLRSIPITPDWPEAKLYVLRNVGYGSYSRVFFQSRTPFWKQDGLSANITFGQPALHQVWQTNQDVSGPRSLLMGSANANVTAEETLATFRRHYPGKSDTTEQARVVDWSKDRWASECELLPFPLGQLKRVWPDIMQPVGRIHFAGAYADNLNWGMEAATRSAHRVAEQIDKA
jgi:monoamine oxidase